MLFSEIIALILFVFFWYFIYSNEAKYIIFFLKRKGFNKSLSAKIIHLFAILGFFCFVYAYFIEPHQLEVKYVNLKNPKIKKAFTLVQISDLHCDTKIRNENKLVRIINEINPNIIVFTGDALNVKDALGVFQKTLKNLKAKSGKFAIRGNFDVWYWKDIDLFSDTGFVELDNKFVILSKAGQCIAVSGFSADNSLKSLDFLEKIPEGCFSVMLFHYPGINEMVTASAIDLYLSGHTHGGQFSLPIYGALITMSRFGKKYEAGLYELSQNRYLYVNRGVGMEGGIAPRIRFFSRPEITVFNINPEKTK